MGSPRLPAWRAASPVGTYTVTSGGGSRRPAGTGSYDAQMSTHRMPPLSGPWSRLSVGRMTHDLLRPWPRVMSLVTWLAALLNSGSVSIPKLTVQPWEWATMVTSLHPWVST